jgi:hypothetical protein
MQALTRIIHPKDCSAIGCSILVYDNDDEAVNLIETLSSEGKIETSEQDGISILESIALSDLTQSDICAVFLSENFDSDGLTGFHIAAKIHRLRSNIPIFMRLDGQRTINDIPTEHRQLITGCYNTCDPAQLKKITDSFLYGYFFPNRLVDILLDAGLFTLKSAIKHCEIRPSRPFLIYDYTLAAEFTSILPIQLPFGNGSLTFSINENDALTLIKNEHTSLQKDQFSIDHCNQLISEITNQFWGKVRRMCAPVYGRDQLRSPVYIPLVVNHKMKYINFGNNTPQLCFRYLLIRDHLIPEGISVGFKIIFNSILRPNDFCELRAISENPNKDDNFESFL